MGFYDHFAKRKKNKFGIKLKYKQNKKIFNLGIKGSNTKSRILDLGPGDGIIAELSSKLDIDYLGIEGSKSVYKKLEKNNIKVIHSMFPPLPSNIGHFDICFFLHVIEHLNNISEAESILTSIHNILLDKGLLVIATPDFMKWGKHFYNSDYTHNLPFTRKRLEQLLQNTGFDVIDSILYVGNLFGLKSVFFYWLIRITYPTFLDDFLNKFNKSNLWLRAYYTFAPNILIISKKKFVKGKEDKSRNFIKD